ncbi:MAG TPA: ComF family protein [Gammaproteobacteria bacterium]|nr:ComF family protein [Gammaproteobacteria bacterium]
MVYNWINSIQSRLTPAFCLLCGHAAEQDLLCHTCRESLPLAESRCQRCAVYLPAPNASLCGHCISKPPPQDAAYAAFRYRPPVRSLLQDLKYNHRLHLANWLADRFCETLSASRHPIQVDCLIPVPLHPGRQRLRGFNQATELARRISRNLKLTMEAGCLQRRRATPKQTGLDMHARKQNLRGAFDLDKSRLPERCALVDDVVTTGATSRELATLLKNNGVKHVEIWSIARADAPG